MFVNVHIKRNKKTKPLHSYATQLVELISHLLDRKKSAAQPHWLTAKKFHWKLQNSLFMSQEWLQAV